MLTVMSRRGYEMNDDEEYMRPMLPTVPEKCGPPVISLGHLLELSIQTIYHELNVLSELLPKKLDSDRKISIVQFAHSTRALFIKLLAAVRWVKSSKKFESCASICYFLDQQGQYFVDTADRLLQLAREELAFARLPCFQVSTAADVLTLGTYPRLPLCIKSRFVPEAPITKREESCILARLNQVLQSRIGMLASKLSPRIRSVIIRNGMVMMTVDGEFEVMFTLLGERETTKWTLLNIRILVEDFEIGFGAKLVHPLQVNLLHNIIQTRMDAEEEPIQDAYMVLHHFALTLQLDVLFCQATQVLSGGMSKYAIIEEYDRVKGRLVINYWLRKIQHNRFASQYRIKIFYDKMDRDSCLIVRHFPAGKNLPSIDARTGHLSMRRLLSETVAMRCRERLLRIRERLSLMRPPVKVRLTGKAAPTLSYPLLGKNSREDEVLVVSVNDYSGVEKAIVRALGERAELRELSDALSERGTLPKIAKLLSRLRVLLMLERYRKAVSPLPVRIVPGKVFDRISGLPSKPSERLCLQFIKEDVYYLIVSFIPSEETGISIEMDIASNIDKTFNLVHLHPAQMLNSLPPSISGLNDDDNSTSPPPAKRRCWLGDTRQLTAAVASLDDRLAFMRICEELKRRNVEYRPLTLEPAVGGPILHIRKFSRAITTGCNDFFDSIINCCLRLDTRARVIWPFECTLINTPLIADFYEPLDEEFDEAVLRTKTTVMEIHGSGGVTSMNTSESVSTNMIDRLTVYSHMYEPARAFEKAYYNYYHKFCSIVAYTYHKLVIAYGGSRDMLMFLSWRTQKSTTIKQFFYLTFGVASLRDTVNETNQGQADFTVWNPHILLTQRLQERFNKRRSLIDLIQYLIDTIKPLLVLHTFVRIHLQSVRAFCQMACYDASLAVIAQVTLSFVDEYKIRLDYGPVELEFLLLGDAKVAVRDCARNAPNAIRLRQFCNMFISQELRNIHDERSPGVTGFMWSASGPGSLPPHQMGRSPASRISASPMSHMSLSVPPADSVGSSLRHPSDLRSKCAITFDHGGLQRMATIDKTGSSPLDDYLFALAYLSRTGPALEGYRREHRGSGAHPVIQFRHLMCSPDSIRLSVTGAGPPYLKHEPFVVNMNIYLDDETMKLRLKLEFEGEDVPQESDIHIAEVYFVRVVARLGNELAVIAFANACRLAVPGAFSAVTRIMNAQMCWVDESPWRPSIQLVMWNAEGAVPRTRISPGIIIDQTNITVLILLCLRPSFYDSNDKNADATKHLIPLIYNTQTNTVARRTSGPDDDGSNATAVLSTVSEQYSLTDEPALWPAVCSLARKFTTKASP